MSYVPDVLARVYSLERDRDRHDKCISDVEEDVEQIRNSVTDLKARVGIYAALGAAAGGAVFSTVSVVAVYFLTGH